jgi:cell division septation protein DedD
MAAEERRMPRSSGPGWLATAGGALLLIALGFGVGIVAGTAYQEPELLADHLAGRTTEVALGAEQGFGGAPDVAAPAPLAPAEPAPALGQGALEAAPEAELAVPARAEATAVAPAAAVAPKLPSAPPKLPSAAPKAAAPAPRPARALPAAAAKAPAAGSFSIQVGAFSSERAARELAGELGKHGYTAYLMDEGNGARWKVRVGPIRSRSEAEEVSSRLKREQRLPTWIQTNG